MIPHFLPSVPSGIALVQVCIPSQLGCCNNYNKLINSLLISNFTFLPSNFQNATVVTFWNGIEQSASWKMNCIHNEVQTPVNNIPGPTWPGAGLPLQLPVHGFPNDSICIRYIQYSLSSTFFANAILFMFKVHSSIPFFYPTFPSPRWPGDTLCLPICNPFPPIFGGVMYPNSRKWTACSKWVIWGGLSIGIVTKL